MGSSPTPGILFFSDRGLFSPPAVFSRQDMALTETLRSAVEVACRQRKFASRVIPGRTEDEVMLYDAPAWDERISSEIRQDFPSLEASVETCSGSLSGFRVHLTARRSRDWGWLGLLGAQAACCCYLLYSLS